MSKISFASEEVLAQAVTAFAAAQSALVLSDYDGVMTPIVDKPELAIITDKAKATVEKLVSIPDTALVVVSGRDRQFLDEQFGHLDIEMSAEHGSFRKTRAGIWRQMQSLDDEARTKILALLEAAASDIAGSHIERKEIGIALHYREALAQEEAEDRADRLVTALTELAKEMPLHIIPGSKVVEVQPSGASKGDAVQHWLSTDIYDMVIAIGDDYTDIAMLEAVAASSINTKLTCGVGKKDIGATLQLPSSVEAIAFLEELASARRRVLLGR